MYIYTHIYIYMHIYIYVYMYIFLALSRLTSHCLLPISGHITLLPQYDDN